MFNSKPPIIALVAHLFFVVTRRHRTSAAAPAVLLMIWAMGVFEIGGISPKLAIEHGGDIPLELGVIPCFSTNPYHIIN